MSGSGLDRLDRIHIFSYQEWTRTEHEKSQTKSCLFWLSCRKGFTLTKHCLSCTFITNFFWRGSMNMQGAKNIVKILLLPMKCLMFLIRNKCSSVKSQDLVTWKLLGVFVGISSKSLSFCVLNCVWLISVSKPCNCLAGHRRAGLKKKISRSSGYNELGDIGYGQSTLNKSWTVRSLSRPAMLFSYVEIKSTEVWLDLAMVTCHNISVSVRTCFFLQAKSKKNQPTTWISCEKALSHLPIYAKLCNRVAIDPAGWSWFRQDIPFFFRARISIRSQTFVKKTEPDLVSLLNFDNSRSFRCNFVCKTIVNFWLHRL